MLKHDVSPLFRHCVLSTIWTDKVKIQFLMISFSLVEIFYLVTFIKTIFLAIDLVILPIISLNRAGNDRISYIISIKGQYCRKTESKCKVEVCEMFHLTGKKQ